MNRRSSLRTIGHSTRSLSELINLLRTHSIDILVDVRRVPASKKFPHFKRQKRGAANQEPVRGALKPTPSEKLKLRPKELLTVAAVAQSNQSES